MLQEPITNYNPKEDQEKYNSIFNFEKIIKYKSLIDKLQSGEEWDSIAT